MVLGKTLVLISKLLSSMFQHYMLLVHVIQISIVKKCLGQVLDCLYSSGFISSSGCSLRDQLSVVVIELKLTACEP